MEADKRIFCKSKKRWLKAISFCKNINYSAPAKDSLTYVPESFE